MLFNCLYYSCLVINYFRDLIIICVVFCINYCSFLDIVSYFVCRSYLNVLYFYFIFKYCPFLLHNYLIESLSRFCISYLFHVYFVSYRYLSLNVMLCHFVSCHVFHIYLCQMLFYLFSYVS